MYHNNFIRLFHNSIEPSASSKESDRLLQLADIGWPTGNGKKLSSTQALLGQATCLAVA